ncbi:Type IV secretion system protein [Enhydrobacter aerosaccus]|uniref:Type IV secretion system protein n=1 Tax=Enhydrobacter aerosaccus TaxID=225324 RepID=A0A1T4TIW5_9HYPH|nr:type IV secretion system protein [Enhydrobacter aerosaccus]SKA40400.1 Type IV secretion system protein [Enhydrobacter aerosaccus]
MVVAKFFRPARGTALALVMALALHGAPARAQVPVEDAAAYAQLVQQLQQLQQQLQQLQQLYNQAQATYSAITGGRAMDVIAPTLNTIRTSVPDDYANNMVLPSALQAFGDIANGAASVIRQGMQITTFPGNDFYNKEVVRHGDRIAGELAAAQAIYNTAVQRRANLDVLRQKLASTTDQATVLQLNARIASETTQGINDLNQINAMQMMQRSNGDIDQQRALEAEKSTRDTAIQGLRGK